MIKQLNLNELNDQQIRQYKNAILNSYPKFIFRSTVLANYWPKLDEHFPTYQHFLIDQAGELIGFFNTIPIYWNQQLNKLPDDGWDWLIKKGIEDKIRGIKPNCLGGLQIIVTKDHLGKGISKKLIGIGKIWQENLGFSKFIIPIRPTLKHLHPRMKMCDYLTLKKEDKIFDPWIRRHVNSGAEIIKVCSNAMNIKADIAFWQTHSREPLNSSGEYLIKGALNSIQIDFEKDLGEYREENIWIVY